MGNGVSERKKLNKKRHGLALQAFIKRHICEFELQRQHIMPKLDSKIF